MRVKYAFSAKFTQKTRKPSYTNQHKVSFLKQAQEIIETADIILEVLDARFIDKTRNPSLEQEIKRRGKKLIWVLNKADLIEVKDVKFNYDLTQLQPYVLFSTKTKIGRTRLREILLIEAKKIKFPQVRVGVIGYPNTGKSSVVNVLCGGKRVGTSPIAGFTKNIQEVRFRGNILILDSPGVITNKEENSIDVRIVKKQTEIGAKDYTKTKYPDLILNDLMKDDPKLFDVYYGVDSSGDVEMLLQKLGEKWGFLKKKGETDLDRAARRVLKDWQEGKITRKIKSK